MTFHTETLQFAGVPPKDSIWVKFLSWFGRRRDRQQERRRSVVRLRYMDSRDELAREIRRLHARLDELERKAGQDSL